MSNFSLPTLAARRLNSANNQLLASKNGSMSRKAILVHDTLICLDQCYYTRGYRMSVNSSF